MEKLDTLIIGMEKIKDKMAIQKSYSIFCVIYIYIFLYSPVLNGIPIPTPLFLLPFTFVFFFNKISVIARFFLLFRTEITILFVLLMYVFFLDFTYGRNVYFTHVFYYIFEVFPLSYFIVDFFFKKSNKESFFKLLILVGTIAAFISVLSYLSPSINNFIAFFLKGNDFTNNSIGRNYGFAFGFLYQYPLCQGIIAVLALRMISENKSYIIPFLLILFSIVINARIGLLPIILYLLLNLNFKSLIYLGLFLSTFIIANTAGLFSKYQELIDWNLIMFYDFSDYFFNTNYSAYGSDGSFFTFIIENFLVYPSTTFGWIFGELREVFSDPIKNSDIGYINDLIYGGLILVILIMFFFMKISMRLWQIKDKESKLFALLFFGIFLIANVKGEFFRPSPANRVIILIFVYFIYNSKMFNQINGNKKQTPVNLI